MTLRSRQGFVTGGHTLFDGRLVAPLRTEEKNPDTWRPQKLFGSSLLASPAEFTKAGSAAAAGGQNRQCRKGNRRHGKSSNGSLAREPLLTWSVARYSIGAPARCRSSTGDQRVRSIAPVTAAATRTTMRASRRTRWRWRWRWRWRFDDIGGLGGQPFFQRARRSFSCGRRGRLFRHDHSPLSVWCSGRNSTIWTWSAGINMSTTLDSKGSFFSSSQVGSAKRKCP